MLRLRFSSLFAVFILSLYLSINAFAAFKNSGTGAGGRVVDPSIPSYTYLSGDVAAQSIGYDSESTMLAAIAQGYSKTQADADLWAQARGITSNAYPTSNATGAFQVPTTGGMFVSMTSAQYATDCMAIFNLTCIALSPAQFKQVKNQTHLALSSGWNSYAQQVASSGAGWSAAELAAAQLLGYANTANDYALYNAAKIDVDNIAGCATIASTAPAPAVCATISKTNYENVVSGIDKVLAVINAAPLTKALILALNIAIPSNVNLDDPQTIAYLDEIITAASGTYPADLSDEIGTAIPQTTALWLVGKIVNGTPGYSPAALTTIVIEAALNSTISLNDLFGFNASINLTDLQTQISTSGLGLQPSATALLAYMVSVFGFSDVASYTAWADNSDKANFQSMTWEACYQHASTDADKCTLTATEWSNLKDVLSDLASGDLTSITPSELLSAAAAEGVSTSLALSGGGAEPVHVDFVRYCLDNLTTAQRTSENIANCVGKTVTDATIYGIAGKIDGTYTGTVTIRELQDAQVASQVTAALNLGDGCGPEGSDSCLAAFNNQVAATNCSQLAATSTSNQVTNYVQCVVTETQVAATDAATYSGPSAVTAGCSSNPSLPMPGLCQHSYWECSLVNAPSGWTISANGDRIIIPASAPQTTGVVHFNIRLYLVTSVFPSNYSRYVSVSQNVSAAFSDASNGKKQFAIDGYTYKFVRGEYAFNNGPDTSRGFSSYVAPNNLAVSREFCRSLGGELGSKAQHMSFGVNLRNYVFNSSNLNWSNLYSSSCMQPYIIQTSCTNVPSCVLDNEEGRSFRGNSCATPSVNGDLAGTYLTCVNLPTC